MIPGGKLTAYLGIEVIARVRRRPKAVLFTKDQVEHVEARICGDCGHVSLFAAHPERLWRAHEEARARKEQT